MPKENNYYLLNDKVVKKLFTNGSKASKEFILLIISYVTKIPFAELEKNFEFIHPQIGINKNIINSEADVVSKQIMLIILLNLIMVIIMVYLKKIFLTYVFFI